MAPKMAAIPSRHALPRACCLPSCLRQRWPRSDRPVTPRQAVALLPIGAAIPYTLRACDMLRISSIVVPTVTMRKSPSNLRATTV